MKQPARATRGTGGDGGDFNAVAVVLLLIVVWYISFGNDSFPYFTRAISLIHFGHRHKSSSQEHCCKSFCQYEKISTLSDISFFREL